MWQKNDLGGAFNMHPDYLMLLSIKIILLLLGPHIAHIIFVVLETHLQQNDNKKKSLFMLHLQVDTGYSNAIMWIKTSHLVQSNPVPGAARIVGRQLEHSFCIFKTVPLILHHKSDQWDVHLVWELQRSFKT